MLTNVGSITWKDIREDKGERAEHLEFEERVWGKAQIDRIGPISWEIYGEYMKKALPDNFEFTENTKVFDFACGMGRFYNLIKDYNCEYYGSDISLYYLSEFAKILEKGILLYSKKMDTFPFPNDYFDLSVACSIFTHLSKTQRSFYLDELTRTLKPKGYLILTFFDSEVERKYLHPLADNPYINCIYIPKTEIINSIKDTFEIEKIGILPDSPPSFQTTLTLRKR